MPGTFESAPVPEGSDGAAPPVDDVLAALEDARSRWDIPEAPVGGADVAGGETAGVSPPSDDAADLVPRFGEHPTESVRYETVVLTDIPGGDGGSDTVRALTGPVDLFDEGLGMYTLPGEGVVVTSDQTWTARGVTLGRLLHSLALAPGESTRIAVVDWNRRDTGTSSDTLGQTEQTSARTSDGRTTSDTAQSSATDRAEGSTTAATSANSTSGGFSAGMSGPTWGVGVSGSASRTGSTATTVARSSDAKQAAAAAAQAISARTEQDAAAVRTRQAAVVRETSQAEGEAVSTRVVTNYNHMHAMSVQYYEVVQVYDVVTTPVRIDRCVFVPMAPLTFTGAALRRYAPVLAAAAPPAWQRLLLAADPFATTVDRTRAGGAPPSTVGMEATGQIVERITQTPMRHLSAAADGTVWGVSTQGVPQRWDVASRTWNPVTAGLAGVTISRIGVGRADVVWAVADGGGVYSYDAATASWQPRPGPLRVVSAGPGGAVWAIGPQDDVESWNGGGWQGNYQRGGTDIAVGDKVYVLGIDRIVSWIDPVAQVWSAAGGAQPVTSIAAAADGSLFGTSDQMQVYRWDGHSAFVQAFLDLPAAARMRVVAPVSARDVWGLDPDGYPLHIHDPRPTTPIDDRADYADPATLTVWWDADTVVRGIELTTAGASGRAMRYGDTGEPLQSGSYTFSVDSPPVAIRLATSPAEGGSVGRIEIVTASAGSTLLPPAPAAGPEPSTTIPLDGVAICGLFGEVGQSGRGRFLARLGFYVRSQASPQDLLRHLNDNRDYYSRVVWANADELTLSRMLATYSYRPTDPAGPSVGDAGEPTSLVPLGACVDPQPVAITGNYLGFRWHHRTESERQAWLRAAGLVEGDPTDSPRAVVSLPSGGVFAEAVLGRANAAEKIDLTRFWNWNDSPIPILPPEIVPVATTSRARDMNLTGSGFDPSLAQLQQLRALPDPTGMREITQTLTQTIFADMSKATENAALAADALKTASTGDQAAGQRSLETYKAALAHQEATMRMAIDAATSLLPLAAPELLAGSTPATTAATTRTGAGSSTSTGLDTIAALAGTPKATGALAALGAITSATGGGNNGGNGGLPGATISDTGGLVNLARAANGTASGHPGSSSAAPSGGSPAPGNGSSAPAPSTATVADEIVKDIGIPALQNALRANPALLDMPPEQAVRLLGDALTANLHDIVEVQQ